MTNRKPTYLLSFEWAMLAVVFIELVVLATVGWQLYFKHDCGWHAIQAVRRLPMIWCSMWGGVRLRRWVWPEKGNRHEQGED